MAMLLSGENGTEFELGLIEETLDEDMQDGDADDKDHFQNKERLRGAIRHAYSGMWMDILSRATLSSESIRTLLQVRPG